MRIKSLINTLILFSFSQGLFAAETEFERLLERSETYRSVMENFSSTKADPKLTEGMATTKKAIDLYIEEKKNPKKPAQASLAAQAEMDMKSCPTCQNYLNLSGQVNEILRSMDTSTEADVETGNKARLELNNLSFLYYVVKYETMNGGIHCAKYGNFNTIQTSQFNGTFQLMAEEVFDLPNVNEVQYIPEGGKEVVYLYRGSGKDKNKVYEVHMLPDGKAKIRFYNYSPSYAELIIENNKTAVDAIITSLPGTDKKEKKRGDDYFEVGVDLKTRDTVILTDVEVINAGKKINLADGLVVSTQAKVSFNEQQTDVAIANDKGEAYIQLNAKNKTEGRTELITVIPMTLPLDEKTKLALGGSVKTEIGIDREKKEVDQNRTINLNLTDHNHKYLDVEVYQKPAEKYSRVSASNNYSLGDSGSVGMNYSLDSAGVRTYSLSKNTNMGDFGTLKTEFGGGNQTKHFVAVQHEVAIGKSSTLSIGARADDGRQYTATFQFKSRF